MAGVISAPTFTGVTTAINVNHVSGDIRMNAGLGHMEIYNGSTWTPLAPGWEQKEILADSILHAQDQIGSYIEEDHANNPTIQDAYQEWVEATERFRVIASMAAK
jgi:hypothetical protein